MIAVYRIGYRRIGKGDDVFDAIHVTFHAPLPLKRRGYVRLAPEHLTSVVRSPALPDDVIALRFLDLTFQNRYALFIVRFFCLLQLFIQPRNLFPRRFRQLYILDRRVNRRHYPPVSDGLCQPDAVDAKQVGPAFGVLRQPQGRLPHPVSLGADDGSDTDIHHLHHRIKRFGKTPFGLLHHLTEPPRRAACGDKIVHFGRVKPGDVVFVVPHGIVVAPQRDVVFPVMAFNQFPCFLSHHPVLNQQIQHPVVGRIDRSPQARHRSLAQLGQLRRIERRKAVPLHFIQ